MLRLKKGILIAIEGIDGSGKSSLAKNLYQDLLNQKYPVLLTKEPGATPLGQQLRSLVQEKKYQSALKQNLCFLPLIAHNILIELIIPALLKIYLLFLIACPILHWYIKARAGGLIIQTIRMVMRWVMNGNKPDITLYVKVSAEVAAQPFFQRNAALTSFEKEKHDFIQKLITGFDTLYKNRNDVIIVDGNQPPEKVTQHATMALISWIKQYQQ